MSADYSVIGLCRRAGRLAVGHDAVIEAVRKGSAKLILLTSDASPRHEREIRALDGEIEIRKFEDDSNTVGYSAGKRACVFAVTDAGFAACILKKTR